jgi:hypothetical protein
MKVYLMFPDRDFDPEAQESGFPDDTARDLELDRLWGAMGGGDAFLRGIARAAVLAPTRDPDTIVYRQRALSDCRRNPEQTRQLYQIAVDAVELRRGIFGMPVHNHPGIELSHAVRHLNELVGQLDRLREFRRVLDREFASPAFRGLSATISRELDDPYMADLRFILRELAFPGGMLMSAGVGDGGQVAGQVLRRARRENRRWYDRTPLARPMFSFVLPERDESGANALAELRDRSVSDVAGAASQAVEHVRSFFTSRATSPPLSRGSAARCASRTLAPRRPRRRRACTTPASRCAPRPSRSATTSVSARETCWSSPARIAGASRRCSGPSGRRS